MITIIDLDTIREVSRERNIYKRPQLPWPEGILVSEVVDVIRHRLREARIVWTSHCSHCQLVWWSDSYSQSALTARPDG